MRTVHLQVLYMSFVQIPYFILSVRVFPTINSVVMIIARALEFQVWYAHMNDRSYHSLRRDSVTMI